jgi:hypothetical protein
VFLNQFLILCHFSDPTITGPIRGRAIPEADVDVFVVGNFVAFLGNVINDEDESKLRVFKGCNCDMVNVN